VTTWSQGHYIRAALQLRDVQIAAGSRHGGDGREAGSGYMTADIGRFDLSTARRRPRLFFLSAGNLSGLRASVRRNLDLKVSSLYRAVPVDARPGIVKVRRTWFVLDPTRQALSH
jgi:hypothetical protein